MKSLEDKQIYTSSYVKGDVPRVMLKYEKSEVILPLIEARRIAISLIQAAAISMAEAGLIKVLIPPERKGFGLVNADRDNKMFIQAVRLVREARMPLHSLVAPIFGQRTRLPLVALVIDKATVTLDPNEAQTIGQRMLEAAEAPESDIFLFKLADTIDIPRSEMAMVVADFAKQRSVNSLNTLWYVDDAEN